MRKETRNLLKVIKSMHKHVYDYIKSKETIVIPFSMKIVGSYKNIWCVSRLTLKSIKDLRDE